MMRGEHWIWFAMVSLVVACGDDGSGSEESDGTSGMTTASTSSTQSGTGSSTSATTGPTSTSDSTTGVDTGSETGDPPPPPTGCEPLPPPEGEVVMVGPDEAGTLAQIVGEAASGTTIALADGMYDLSGSPPLVFDTDGVTLRSQSGDAEAVVLDGGYTLGEIAFVRASDVTIAEITLQRAMWHPIHVTGGTDANTTDTVIHGVRTIDPGQQAIKINASPEGFYADGGVVACSHVELTDAGRPQVTDCYTGGIDAHSAWGWQIYDNDFEGFWCDAGLSEHAIHFWVTGRDTLVERNVIVDCARGVGFGLGENGNGNERVYDDDPCPQASYLGHVDGIIRNNTIWAARPELFASQAGFDSGVALEQACGAEVVHNTVVSLQQPFVSMEYRFANTDAHIANNLVTHQIMMRDGATAMLEGNMENASTDEVVDAANGDLHLAGGSMAIDAGVVLSPGLADADIDGDNRDPNPDVGADEWVR